MFLFRSDKNSGCYGNLYFHRLIVVKVKIDNFFCLNWDIWNFFLQKCLLSSPLSFICLILSSLARAKFAEYTKKKKPTQHKVGLNSIDEIVPSIRKSSQSRQNRHHLCQAYY